MSERFWIIVVVAVGVLLLILILRSQLKRLAFKVAGVEAEVETHGAESASRAAAEPIKRRAGINISDVNQAGSDNVIDVGRDDVNIERLSQKDKNKVVVRPDQPQP